MAILFKGAASGPTSWSSVRPRTKALTSLIWLISTTCFGCVGVFERLETQETRY